MSDCLFCKIVAGEIPATIVARNEDYVAFEDIDPKAPTHILVIPVAHVRSFAEADDRTLGGVMAFARELAAERGLVDDGYRIVTNVNEQGGQAVYHLHVHLLAGRQMKWPPG